MRRYTVAVLPVLLALVAGNAAFGQDTDPKKRPGVPMTPTQDGPKSGSRNMGSTGWTGGEGSTQMGVTEEGPPGSGQPEVAKGLDPLKDKDRPRVKAGK
jgi:hypothetical protein